MDTAPEREPLELRVELHPFLVGLHSHHIRLLADCAMARSFEAGEYLFRQGEFANRFYLIEQGMVVLEALEQRGNLRRDRKGRSGQTGGLVVAFPSLHLAFRRARDRADQRALFLRHNPARILRQGSVVRLRAFQKDEPGDGRALAVRPRASSQQPFHPRKSEEPGEAAAVRRERRVASTVARSWRAYRASFDDRKRPTGSMGALPNQNRPRQ